MKILNLLAVLVAITSSAFTVQLYRQWHDEQAWQASWLIAAPLPPPAPQPIVVGPAVAVAVAAVGTPLRLFGKIDSLEFCESRMLCAIVVNRTTIRLRAGQPIQREDCAQASECMLDVDNRNIRLHSQPGSTPYAEVQCHVTAEFRCTVQAGEGDYAHTVELTRFSGRVEGIDDACHLDGVCALTVSGVAVTTGMGRTRVPPLPWGTAGVGIGIGDRVDVYCRKISSKACSLEGDAGFHVIANPWTRLSAEEHERIAAGEAGAEWKRNYKTFILYTLDEQQMQRSMLVEARKHQKGILMPLPMADGSMRTVRFVVHSVMAPEDAAQRREIESFRLEHPPGGSATWGPSSFDVLIGSETYIAPYDRRADNGYYIVYNQNDYIGPPPTGGCDTIDADLSPGGASDGPAAAIAQCMPAKR